MMNCASSSKCDLISSQENIGNNKLSVEEDIWPKDDFDEYISKFEESGEKVSSEISDESVILLSGESNWPYPEDEFDDLISPNVGNFVSSYEGVCVDFPYEPYKSQEEMMKHIIAGVSHGENCLLESPTGTGKTAALLCALLAWQVRIDQKIGERRNLEKLKKSPCTCGFDLDPDASFVKTLDALTGETRVTRQTTHMMQQLILNSPKRKIVIRNPEETRAISDICSHCVSINVEQNLDDQNEVYLENTPVIYYATRTHSQIKQVVTQLKQTAYAGVPMTILSSRRQTCINDEALNSENVDDECLIRQQNTILKKEREQNMTTLDSSCTQKGEKGPFCNYAEDKYLVSSMYHQFRDIQNCVPFDIEELVEYGKSCEVCPYYGAKELHQSAKIVFCPYQYILYPWFQSAMGIKIPGNIIVFDEAHNIEDICRDVASVSIHEDGIHKWQRQVDEFREKLKKSYEKGKRKEVVDRILGEYWISFTKLKKWIQDQGLRLPILTYTQLSEAEVVTKFEEIGFGEKTLDTHFAYIKIFKDNDAEVKVPSEIISFVERIVYTLRSYYVNGKDGIPDYGTVLIKHEPKFTPSKTKRTKVAFTYELKLVCMNPGKTFKKLAPAHTIIVASGTLSPIESFKSELGVSFQHILSARHVIGRDQIWGGILTEKSFQKKERDDEWLQDWLGSVILSICDIVPSGVLVFLPSYGYLRQLLYRWELFPTEDTLMAKLRRIKQVFIEETGSNKASFKHCMEQYKHVVQSRGCVFFGVFRGKASEGVDFKDEEARSVIAVGIPHLPIKDPEVELKMKYNDRRSEFDRTFMSGNDWYSAQGFRALNQALGRCIRDKNDWGGVILLDSRFKLWKNKASLSAWLHEYLSNYETQHNLGISLNQFISRKLAI